ncbi:MAG: DUF3352 domain-containing protein [Cyanothece sp. SIO1E1]|nr:DUF3352 domain-containing protein [Cyanothece sp. SIO1E1]
MSRQGPVSADLPVGSKVVPESALLTMAISTDKGQWQKLRRFGTSESQAALDQNLVKWRDRLLTANGYDFQRDILPWVGPEITLALMPAELNTALKPTNQISQSENSQSEDPEDPDSDGSETAAEADSDLQPQASEADSDQSMVMVLPINNLLKAKQLLERAPLPEAGETATKEYKGVQIWQTPNSDADQYAATVLEQKFLVVATHTSLLEQAIDTYKGEASIATTPGYKEAFGQLDTIQPFAKLYVNVPAASTLASASATQPLSPQGLSQLQNHQGIAATASLDQTGIRLQGVSWLKPDSELKHEVGNKAGQMPRLLPEQVLVMASGGNLQQLWQDYAKGAEKSPLTPFNPNLLGSGIQATTGLNLNADLLPWMAGEFSLALIPSDQADAAGLSAGLLLMVKVSDRNAAETALKRLDEVMASRHRFDVKTVKVNNQDVIHWTSPGSLVITRGWLDSNVAFLAFGAPVVNTFIPQPNPSLAASELFEETASSALKSNNGRFFINVEQLLNAGTQFPFPQLPPKNEKFARAIRAIGVTAAVQNEHTTRYDIYVALRKGERPGPLPSDSSEPTTP